MAWIWLEAALPLGIIAGMLCVMGNAQYFIHKAYHGRVRSTSGTICGTSPWKEGIRSSSRTSLPPIDPFLVFFWSMNYFGLNQEFDFEF
ncbi:NADH dehydrogenase [ubiquinone] 1 alpha subcomplex subunit 1 [Gossypium australe]|uniref:NADH dehydrogenase [ubiquinone] 1 alpha subcomplex subunit 1 n=1 Tax=Gossypium australe TaxID=47621 RepID=A0A5B6WE61_9ROSI|nr:NADH dehydrogenase [ubiquinone] 1 alpha subcomplex subunit 1 [Gossypium australe]